MIETVSEIVAGSENHAVQLVKQGAIGEIVRLLRTPHKTLNGKACWALGEIAHSCVQLRDEVLSAGAMDALLEVSQLGMVSDAAVAFTLRALCDRPYPPFQEVRLCLMIGLWCQKTAFLMKASFHLNERVV